MKRTASARLSWIDAGISVLAVLCLTSCATRKEKLLPHGDSTMLDIWTANTAGGLSSVRPSRVLVDARASLRRPLDAPDREVSVVDTRNYTRSAQTEIDRLFVRLPNPDLVMYIFPHLAGDHPVPVPGYSTVFPLYETVQYAMPGERTESY